MPITTASEFEAVIGQALIKIDKVLYARGDVPAIKDARRVLETAHDTARDPAKLKALRQKLSDAIDSLTAEISDDEDLRHDLWDLTDYIDFGL